MNLFRNTVIFILLNFCNHINAEQTNKELAAEIASSIEVFGFDLNEVNESLIINQNNALKEFEVYDNPLTDEYVKEKTQALRNKIIRGNLLLLRGNIEKDIKTLQTNLLLKNFNREELELLDRFIGLGLDIKFSNLTENYTSSLTNIFLEQLDDDLKIIEEYQNAKNSILWKKSESVNIITSFPFNMTENIGEWSEISLENNTYKSIKLNDGFEAFVVNGQLYIEFGFIKECAKNPSEPKLKISKVKIDDLSTDILMWQVNRGASVESNLCTTISTPLSDNANNYFIEKMINNQNVYISNFIIIPTLGF